VLNLAVKEIELIGLTCQDRAQFNIGPESRIPMTERDKAKLLGMIRTYTLGESPGASQLRDRGWRDNNHEQVLVSQGHRAYM
jgi:meiotic recombination protein SPO11